MTRLKGPDNSDLLSYTIGNSGNLKSLAGETVVFYNDLNPAIAPLQAWANDGNRADILTEAGAPIVNSQLELSTASKYTTIQFPDGTPLGPDSLIVSVNGGPVQRVYAREKDQIDAAETRLTALEAGGAGDALLLHKAGSEAISGVKTFNVSPVVPTPTTSTQAASKGYADGLVDDLSGVTNATAARAAIGLGNVDNTSDTLKPISTATSAALATKATLTGYANEKAFRIDFATAANEKADLYFTTGGVLFAQFEITIVGLFSGANAGGTIKAVLTLGANASGTIYDSTLAYTAVQGPISGHFGILGPPTWDAANSRYRITLVHRTSTANSVSVLVKAVGNTTANLDAINNTLAVSSIYTSDATTIVAPSLNPVVVKTAAYTLTDADSIIAADATSAAFNLTLPTAVGRFGKQYTLQRINAGDNPVTVATTSSQTINGLTSWILAEQYSSVTVASDGSNWRVVVRIGNFGVDVADFGARPGGTDCTTPLRNAAASGASRFFFRPGSYVTSSLADGGAPLMAFSGRDGITIDAAEAKFTNPTSYVGSSLTTIFSFDACKNIRVTLGEYAGLALATPETDLGYKGVTLVRLFNRCDGAKIDAKVTNARYGVLSGDYDSASLGYNKNIDIRLRTSFCGYPVAMYLAENVKYDVDADDVHRAVYLGGCLDVKGVARWQNVYIAPFATLITDSKTGTGTSRASANIDVESIDKGSTVFTNTTGCAAISLSRVDPGMVYENIRVKVFTKSTDSISSRIGGFVISSTQLAKDQTEPPATYGWDPSIVLRNITVSGIVDHSAQTTAGNTQGDIFVRTYDTVSMVTQSATVENINFDGLVIKQSPGNPTPLRVECPGLSGSGAAFQRFSATNAQLILETNASAPTKLADSAVKELYVSGTSQSAITLDNAKVDTLTEETAGNALVSMANSTIFGAGTFTRPKVALVNLTGASVTVSGAIPAGALVFGVQAIIKTAITGSSGLQIGVSGALTRYLDTSTVAVNSTFGPADSSETSPRYYPVATDLVLTSKASNFTAGQVRLIIHYLAFTAPTS